MKPKLIAFLLVHAIALPSYGVSPGAEALSATTNADTLANAVDRATVRVPSEPFLSIQEYLSLSFRIPVSYEWPYIDDTRAALPPPRIDPWIREEEDLRSALDTLRVATDGALTWAQIRGNVCVLAPDGAQGTENTLDTVLSLHVEDVSTWEALRRLGEEINGREHSNRHTKLSPSFLAHSRAAPPGFRDGNEVTLELEEVTAREALCAIIRESQFEIAYSYETHYRPIEYPESKPRARITIILFENGSYLASRDRMSLEESVLFNLEIKSMEKDE